jgi:aspartate racemase
MSLLTPVVPAPAVVERTASGRGNQEVWGIVGGMGPLASAAFLSTIYERRAGLAEQELPTILLLSDPTSPDRTEALLGGRGSQLAQEVGRRATALLDAGATTIILCCVTIHAVASSLPVPVQRRLRSLADIIIEGIAATPGRHLLLCTQGTRRTRVFETHARWPEVQARIVFPDDGDQRAIHSVIYEIKKNRSSRAHAALLDRLRDRYKVECLVAGCTELHILTRRCDQRKRWIDPLSVLAAEIGARQSRPVTEPAGELDRVLE